MIKAVLFDIDGVLMDSKEANREFFSRLLKVFGYTSPTKEEYHKVFHLTMWDAIKELTGEKNENKVKTIWEAGSNRDFYPIELLKATVDLRDTINKLKKKYRLGIVTSRIKAGIEDFYKISNLKEQFEIEVGFGDYAKPKPDPECLTVACSKLNIKPSEAVYVGDTETDMIAAREAGMHFILFPENPQLKTKFVVKEFKYIPKIIEDYFSR